MVSKFRQTWRFIPIVFTCLAGLLLLQCGASDRDEDNDESDKPKVTENTVPENWDGTTDWTESAWTLEDE